MHRSKSISVYEEILCYLEDNPNEVYLNQDFQEAGKEDTVFLIWGKELPREVQKSKAEELLRFISDYIKNNKGYKKLIEYITESKFITYYFAFYKLLELYVKEKIIDKEKLYEAGLKLSTCSNKPEEIKVGITLLALSQNRAAVDILKVFAVHSEYTFYSVTSLKEYDYYNSIIFEIGKRSLGFGKIHCLHNLEPINEEIKKWIIEEGCHNVVLKAISAIMSLNKVSMSWYLEHNDIGYKEFSAISRILYYILSVKGSDIHEIEDSLKTVRLYLKYADKYAKSFYDLCVIAYIEKWMQPDWDSIEKYAHDGSGWTRNIESNIMDKCRRILKDKKWWRKVLYEAMKEGGEESEQYILAAKAIDLELTFSDFKPVLKSKPFDINAFYYLADKKDSENVKALINLARESLPIEDICMEPQDIDDDITEEFKPDICLLCVLKALKASEVIELELPKRALFARMPGCRLEAVDYLRKHKDIWDDEVKERLKKAEEQEPVKSIRKKIRRLIEQEEDGSRVRKYSDIKSQKVKPHVNDVYLFSTEIAGVLYRDMSIIEDKLKVSSLLFLKREPENPYDENAIMVATDEGYLLGYIPRKINTIPKNLMDGGKYLYGKVKEIDLEKDFIYADIYLSYNDVLQTIKEIMTMTKDSPEGFIM